MRFFTKTNLIPSAVAFAILFAFGSTWAQEAPKNPGPRHGDGARARGILEELTAEERQRLRTALNRIWHAEEVEQRRQAMLEANLAYRKALNEEIRKMDASSKERSIMLKILELRFNDDGGGERGKPGRGGDRPDLTAPDEMLRLSEEDRSILKAARTKAEASPALMAAKDQVNQAVTTRERAAASGHYRRVMRREMERADPR
ncbi:MAG: hypothetical protein ACR2RV_21145, partial [Verrucomicrobiales bacterium]